MLIYAKKLSRKQCAYVKENKSYVLLDDARKRVSNSEFITICENRT